MFLKAKFGVYENENDIKPFKTEEFATALNTEDTFTFLNSDERDNTGLAEDLLDRVQGLLGKAVDFEIKRRTKPETCIQI